jgi:hypothetical protein
MHFPAGGSPELSEFPDAVGGRHDVALRLAVLTDASANATNGLGEREQIAMRLSDRRSAGRRYAEHGPIRAAWISHVPAEHRRVIRPREDAHFERPRITPEDFHSV